MRASHKYMAIMAILPVIMQGIQGIVWSPAFAQKATKRPVARPSSAAAGPAAPRLLPQNIERREPPMVSRT
jgi:hypothetical protein